MTAAAEPRHTMMQERYAALLRKVGEEGIGADGGILALANGPQQLSVALRAKEQELEQLRTEHERHAHAYRDIFDEVSRLREQLSAFMPQEGDAPRSSGRRSSPQALSTPPHHKVAKNPPISYRFPSDDGDGGSVDRTWCPQGDSRGTNGDMPGWCAPERELKHRQGVGGRSGDRIMERGGSGGADPLVIFSRSVLLVMCVTCVCVCVCLSVSPSFCPGASSLPLVLLDLCFAPQSRENWRTYTVLDAALTVRVLANSFNFANPLSWGRVQRTDPAEDR